MMSRNTFPEPQPGSAYWDDPQSPSRVKVIVNTISYDLFPASVDFSTYVIVKSVTIYIQVSVSTMPRPQVETWTIYLLTRWSKEPNNRQEVPSKWEFFLRVCSHIMSAKNGGPDPPSPLVSQKSEIGYPPLPPLSEIIFFLTPIE